MSFPLTEKGDYAMLVFEQFYLFIKAYCEYKGYYYRQGESWNDGCSLNCRCEDATNQYYQCTDR